MSEWIITHLTEPTPESTFEEKGLPANKQVWGILRDFVGTHPAGQAVRNHFRNVVRVDFDDMLLHRVFFAGNKYDEEGETTWFIPFRQSGFVATLKSHWIPIKIKHDLSAERAQEVAERKQGRVDSKKDLKDQLAAEQQALEDATIKAQIAEMQRKRQALEQGAVTPSSGSTSTGSTLPPLTGLRSYELFGVLNNSTVPLMQVLQRAGTGWAVIAGARVLVTNVSNEGFGLAGVPGRWAEFYAGRSPTEFGQDADKAVLFLDAASRRGFAVPAQQLAEFFGPNWRAAVYY